MCVSLWRVMLKARHGIHVSDMELCSRGEPCVCEMQSPAEGEAKRACVRCTVLLEACRGMCEM